MILAPIIVFTYNRPWHTEQTLTALKKNDLANESLLYIFCDGIKPNSGKKEIESIKKVRNIVKSKNWCKVVKVTERKVNYGLSKNIIEGVTEIINKHGKVIVLEDDLVPEVGFLSYMNHAIEMYENEEKVGCIHAWNYYFKKNTFKNSTFFLKGGDCWGWATWANQWKLFNPNGQQLLNEIKKKNLEFEFDRRGTHQYTSMLNDQISGRNDSWAIRWHASLFLAEKFCLQPYMPIVKNIGLDNTGIHSKKIKITQKTIKNIKINKLKILEDDIFFNAYIKNYKSKKSLKVLIKKNIPKFILNILKNINVENNQKIKWIGFYNNWSSALKLTSGYDSIEILENCKKSLTEVKEGRAIYERDSILFKEIEYSWGLVSFLLKSIIENKSLDILDFGGSLGSSYYQNKNIFPSNTIIKWSIVEQKLFVECGKKNFENDILKFYYTIEECLKERNPKIVLLSSVLQYLENPFNLISEINSMNEIKYIVIDRTSFIKNNYHKICIQQNIDTELKGSYPTWFFNRNKLIELFDNFELISSFDNGFTPPTKINNISCYWSGLILKKV